MTEAEIVAAIKADPALTQLAKDGRDGEIAKLIPPAAKPVSFLLRSAKVLSMFNTQAAPHAGGVILGKLRALGATTPATAITTNTAEIVRLMDSGGWELIDASVPPIFAAWKAGNVLGDPEINAIKALAMDSARPGVAEVSAALNPFRPDGRVGQLVGF